MADIQLFRPKRTVFKGSTSGGDIGAQLSAKAMLIHVS